jgi:anti-anti-sigma factor
MASLNSPARRGGASLVTLTGDLGAANVPAIRTTMSTALQGQPHDLVIDMRQVHRMSLEAVAVLVAAKTRLKSLNRRLTLVCAEGSPTDHALGEAGMHGQFVLVPTIPQE